MKQTLFSIVFLLLFLGTEAQKNNRKLSAFTQVSAQEGIAVFLKKGDAYTARIETDNIDESKVLTEVDEQRLKIHLDGNNNRNVDVRVYVTYIELEGLAASSAASIVAEDDITASDDFYLSCSSAGDIELELTADEVEINVSSSGGIKLKVEASQMDIDLSSAGDLEIAGVVQEVMVNSSSSAELDGYDFTAAKADLRASSGASIKISVTERLDARASSGASIRYKGSPSQSAIDSSSGGSVRKY